MNTDKNGLKRAGELGALAGWLAALLVLICLRAPAQTSPYVRPSIAEVRSVRLEVAQPLYQTELRIRVSDYSANAHQMTNVTCDIYYVDERSKEAKLGSAKLRQESAGSDKYSGSFSSEHEFTHGAVAKVSYQSPGLRFPISTWYTLTFH